MHLSQCCVRKGCRDPITYSVQTPIYPHCRNTPDELFHPITHDTMASYSRSDGMKCRSHADECCRLMDFFAHCILRSIHITIDFRHRSIISDRACQNKWNTVFHTAEDNTVINLFLIDECRNGATTTNGIQCVQMIVVSWWDGLLCIDVLTKCCMEQAASRSCVASAFPARSACTYPLVTSFSNAFREEASKAHAGPMTHTIRPCCFSYFNEECAKESC